jgi:cyclophilin family peptidyl-prolyl cis-trans isomerase
MKLKHSILGIFAALSLSTATLHAAPTVEMSTSQGKIVVELNAERAPKSVANFLQYARDGFYNGTIFHRVIPGFMIQGGGFDAAMNQKPTRDAIENEARNGLKNARGTLAMARRGDPHSATAQFFINHNNNGFLDYPSQDGWGYAVFGKVTQGMDVVDKIAQVPTSNAGMHQNVPRTPIVIESVKIISEK